MTWNYWLSRAASVVLVLGAMGVLVHCGPNMPPPAPPSPAPAPVPPVAPPPPSAKGADPAAQPVPRSVGEIQKDMGDVNEKLTQILVDGPLMQDADKRTAAAPKAIELIRRMQGLDAEYGAATGRGEMMAKQAEGYDVDLMLFGDPGTRAALEKDASAGDAEAAFAAQVKLFDADWIIADKNPEQQGKLLDEAAELVKEHPDDDDLTSVLYRVAQPYAANSDLQGRAHALMSTMTSSAFQQIKAHEEAEAARDKKLHDFEGKPVAIAGKTVDGKDFSTADWKGKVILVDFWATWCAPCRGELPRVKKAYAEFHDKGFEVVGVSNDFSGDALEKFVAGDPGMPWPQIFNAEAAAKENWNPITTGFGINGIPVMFLIDKKGVLRTVDARANFEDLIPKMLAETGSDIAAVPAAATAGGAATQPAVRTRAEIQADLSDTGKKLSAIWKTPGLVTDADARAKAAPEAIGLVKKMKGLYQEWNDAKAGLPTGVSVQYYMDSYLVVFGDSQTVARLQAEALEVGGASPEAGYAQGALWRGEWILDGKDAAAQGNLLDEIEAAAKAAPESNQITTDLLHLDGSFAASSELTDRKFKIIAAMTSPLAKRVIAQRAAEAKLHGLEGQPLVITGKTVEGKDFSTADWKGKVILVDFWATWCGPCRAELPRVKKAYADFHGQGLEVVGVSNDYSAAALQKFVAADPGMPWPQLFDAGAAAQQNWNPTTLGFGINGIPVMFLIDKKGVVRTVDARENFEVLIPKMLGE